MDSINPILLIPIVVAVVIAVVVVGAVIGIAIWVSRSNMAGRGGPQGPRVPALVVWQATGPALQQLGMQPLDAECYIRNVDGADLYVRFEAKDGSVFAWLERAFPGGVLELFLGTSIDVSPGDARLRILPTSS
jgi:hypothetical protein